MCPYVPMVLFIRHRGYRWDIEQKHPYNIHKCHFPIHEKYAAVFFMDESWTVAGRVSLAAFHILFVLNKNGATHFPPRDPLIWCVVLCLCFLYFSCRFPIQMYFRDTIPGRYIRKVEQAFPPTDRYIEHNFMELNGNVTRKQRGKKILFYCKSFRLLTVPLWIESWGRESTSISEYCENNLNSKHCTRSILMCFVCISQNAIYADSRQKFIGHRGMLNHRPAQNIESKPNSVWFDGVC